MAYGEITSSVFEHLLNLSLQWHLKKKIGQVIRSMDRYDQPFRFAALVETTGLLLSWRPLLLEHMMSLHSRKASPSESRLWVRLLMCFSVCFSSGARTRPTRSSPTSSSVRPLPLPSILLHKFLSKLSAD